MKMIAGENMKIERIRETELLLTIDGHGHMMSVDELHELRKLTELFWDANSLHTTRDIVPPTPKPKWGTGLGKGW